MGCVGAKERHDRRQENVQKPEQPDYHPMESKLKNNDGQRQKEGREEVRQEPIASSKQRKNPSSINQYPDLKNSAQKENKNPSVVDIKYSSGFYNQDHTPANQVQSSKVSNKKSEKAEEPEPVQQESTKQRKQPKIKEQYLYQSHAPSFQKSLRQHNQMYASNFRPGEQSNSRQEMKVNIVQVASRQQSRQQHIHRDSSQIPFEASLLENRNNQKEQTIPPEQSEHSIQKINQEVPEYANNRVSEKERSKISQKNRISEREYSRASEVENARFPEREFSKPSERENSRASETQKSLLKLNKDKFQSKPRESAFKNGVDSIPEEGENSLVGLDLWNSKLLKLNL